MNAQKSSAMPPSTARRAERPRSFAIARARTVSHLGRSSNANDGSGRAPTSGIQHLDELAGCVLASEAQEDLLETLRPGVRAAPEVVHRAARANRPLRDDRHPIAQRLGDLQRVRAHHDRVTATSVLA